MSVRINAEISETIRGRLLKFCAAQVCFNKIPRPLLRVQTPQNCGSYSFDARIKILTEIYCSHRLKNVNMKADILKTIKYRELGLQI